MKPLLIGAILTISFLSMCIISNLSIELEATRHEVISLEQSYQWKSKRLATYLQIVLKQNDIIDRFKSSREAKIADKELNELQQKLN